MLTPIRTRGRKKRPWEPSDGVPRPKASGPKGGRPMKPPKSRDASSQPESNKRVRLLVKPPPPKQRKKLSRLEALPVELIEKIFLYSLSVNLPRCSRSIAAAVSSARIYRALTLLAFWEDSSARDLMSEATPETGASIEAAATAADAEISRILRPLEYVPLREEERRSFQSAVLRCRWCTIDRLLSHLPDLMRLTVRRYWLNTNVNMDSDSEDSLRLFLAQKGEVNNFKGTDKDDNHYTLFIAPLVSVTITCLETEQQTTHRILGALEIPDKLLSGTDKGFNKSHTRFLEILRVASGFNRSDIAAATKISLNREAIQQGIHTALIEHNAEALTTLLKIDEYTFRQENISTALTFPYMLPPEHFRTAVRVARNDPGLFQLLLRANAESIPPDDSEITQWAMDLGGSFGPWLLDFMLQLPLRIEAAKSQPVEGSTFYLGRANSQISIGARYLRDVLGVDSLEGWMEEITYDISNKWLVGG
ncbi:hypothetical protein BDV12DRAFT_6859 [Aspergillus spectabilis]